MYVGERVEECGQLLWQDIDVRRTPTLSIEPPKVQKVDSNVVDILKLKDSACSVAQIAKIQTPGNVSLSTECLHFMNTFYKVAQKASNKGAEMFLGVLGKTYQPRTFRGAHQSRKYYWRQAEKWEPFVTVVSLRSTDFLRASASLIELLELGPYQKGLCDTDSTRITC